MTEIVLDSYALMAFFEGEPGADAVKKLLLDAENGKCRLLICVVNLGEIWYSIARVKDAKTADRYVSELRGMAIEVLDADWEITRQAAVFKRGGSLAYADCYAAAVAALNHTSLVTGDREFEKVEGEIKIVWL
jgi:ribonuclease VapC